MTICVRPTQALLLVAFFNLSSQSAVSPNPQPRLKESRLEQVREARVEWARRRVVHPPLGLYHDYRAILHVHAGDAEHTLGTREQVLEAAKETGVDVVMWTDHRGPKPDSWSGFRRGVLFIPGAEEDHLLRYPHAGGDLKFLSHLEETPNASAEGTAGMEIYNRHSDAKAHDDFTKYLQSVVKDAGEWRKLAALQKRYPDEFYAAGTGSLPDFLSKYDREIARHSYTGIAANDAHRNQVFNGVVFDPYEVAFRYVSTHILAQHLTEEEIRESLTKGHAYVAHDWLCDPNGFSFAASNNLGVFDMGDSVPLMPNTRLLAQFPIPAHIKLIHNGAVVFETTGAGTTFLPKEKGAYRLEAWLNVGGEERPWIYSNPLYLTEAGPPLAAAVPSTLAGNVRQTAGISYADGKAEDAEKHKLDLYLPADKTKFPVLLFIHGGSWRAGDRGQYGFLGNRFAKLGVGVVIPSYRLAPKNVHPAQMEDVAAAFAWAVKHIGEYGGDAGRIFLAGHSAGGHLVSLLALDPSYLKKYDLNPHLIQGVMSLSGVYDVRQIGIFGPDEQTRRAASPIEYVNKNAPPFLVTYCQWDYPGLPAQARAFDRSLRHHFVASLLRFIGGENHISEIVRIWQDQDSLAGEMLRFMGVTVAA